MNQKVLCLFSLGLLVMVGLLAVPNYSKAQQIQSAVKVPILKITSCDGHWARTPILIGQQLTWESDGTKEIFSFTPEVLDGDKSVRVRIDRLGVHANKEKLEILTVSIGAAGVASAKTPFKVEIEPPKTEPHASVRPVSYESPALGAVGGAPGFFAQCCVSCFGNRICAECSVQTECGCCCTSQDACCGFCL